MFTQFPALLSGQKAGLNVTVSNHGLVFLVTSHHPEATQVPRKMHFNRTSDTTITHKRQRDLGALCQEPGSKKKKKKRTKDVHSTLMSWDIIRVLEAL